jgi:hypothetical protein
MIAFKNIDLGELFYLVEDGVYFKYQKISNREAILIEYCGSEDVTEFSTEYSVFNV